ncbi:hypothetical protein [Streptomyces hydrogenans]|uniref:hypothetical protein n=1 Tax=Streptomyces hydrogenans TaxID=1873719 RepID=UPI00167EBBD6|nr:hypothetical protein [Streptomyces hydrogenans]
MITTRRSRPRVRVLLDVLLGAPTVQPAETRRAPAPCASPREPSLAAALSRDLAAALDGRESTVAVAVRHPVRGLRCELDDSRLYGSAAALWQGLSRDRLDRVLREAGSPCSPPSPAAPGPSP